MSEGQMSHQKCICAECEDMRLDAARYRYLRLAAVPIMGKADVFAGPVKFTVETCLYDRDKWAEFVDARIDAARFVQRASPQEQKP